MRVIIIVAGEVGYHVAERLAKEQHDVVVVDVDAERLDYVESHLDVAVIEGSGASPSVLERARIDGAGLLLAVTSVDEVNLVCSMTARRSAGLVKVVRVSNPDFYDEVGLIRPERFGVDLMINPERELALEALRLMQSAAATDIAVFAGGAVQLVGLVVTERAPVANRTLMEVAKEQREHHLLTAAIERDGQTLIPSGTTRIQVGDRVYMVAGEREIPHALALCGHEYAPVQKVMLTGGTHETYYLATLLEENGVHPIVIVEDRARAQELAERLDKTLILNAAATDVELLELEGVGGMDAFVALTDSDETNIISALFARHAGAKQVITLVNKPDYAALARRIGLDAAVSPRQSAANAILRYVRRGSVTGVAIFKDGGAEALSMTVSAKAPVVGRPLAELRFPKHAIIGAIVRGQEMIIPSGRDQLRAGDTAVVFALPDAVSSVMKLFPS